MSLSIAFSPCPNDTFIFDALVNHKIDTEGLGFEVFLEDVETLNSNALLNKYDITKISYGAYHKLADEYLILDSGSALGTGVGPLLISREVIPEDEVANKTIAIPGENTTAHFLFSLAYPQATKKVFLRYDEIERFVLEGQGLGVIIHENRFTYKEKGLHAIKDLGSYWEQTTGNPIPLGCIAVKRTMDAALRRRLEQLIRESIRYAYTKYPLLDEYVRCNAQELSEDVLHSHINLYVNDYSLSLGEKGRGAVRKLLEVAGNAMHKTVRSDIFSD